MLPFCHRHKALVGNRDVRVFISELLIKFEEFFKDLGKLMQIYFIEDSSVKGPAIVDES